MNVVVAVCLNANLAVNDSLLHGSTFDVSVKDSLFGDPQAVDHALTQSQYEADQDHVVSVHNKAVVVSSKPCRSVIAIIQRLYIKFVALQIVVSVDH